MTEARSGVWWLADEPTRRIPGTLIRSNNRWQLSVTGRLPGQLGSEGLSLVPLETIHGACLGIRYTLNGCYLTSSRSPGGPRHAGDDGDDQYSQTWIGHFLTKGAALPAATRYSAARFQLTQLTHWWQRGGLRGRNAATSEYDYIAPEPTTVECDDGLTLEVWADISSRIGSRHRSMTEEVYLSARRNDGFTIDELFDDIVLPLRRLLSIIHSARGEYHDGRLYLADEPDRPLIIDPEINPAAGRDVWREDRLFPGDDRAIRTLFPEWLRMHRSNELSIVVAEPGYGGGTGQAHAVELVNALETLHRALHPAPTANPFADKVADAVASLTGFTKQQRKRIVMGVSINEVRLEKRLLELARGLGAPFVEWFFRGQVTDWAYTLSQVRNALAHGYHTPHRLGYDSRTIVAIVETARVVLRLCLLAQAGTPTDSSFVPMLEANPDVSHVRNQSLVEWRTTANRIRIER